MTVISIIPVDKRRCKVLFEEDFALVLYRGEIKKYEIKEKEELSEACYQEILHDVLCKRARERILYLLKNGDKTEEQLRRKLKDGCYPEEAIDYALSFVKERHYVDDQAYAERYVQFYSEKKSKRQIACNLRQKGIDKEIITRALEGGEVDEDRQVAELLRKKGFPKNRMPEGREELAEARREYQKVAASLARKGFSWEAIRRGMAEL